MITKFAFAIGLVATSTTTFGATTQDDWCRDARRGDRRSERFCEVREFSLDGDGRIRVDARTNGGIEVEGWDRSDVRVLARVVAWSDDEDDAERLAGEVSIETDRTIRAEGPRSRRREGWSVSYRLMVPRNSDLDLETMNGGISLRDVSGQINLEAVNGGLSLRGASGDIRGRTTNGGLDIDLSGDAWRGAGLDVETTNGGVSLRVPEGYSAELETGTVNGGIEVDFPITVQGRLRRRLRTTLGNGGALIRAITTNGGVQIARP